jgi:subtilisin family serine protease
MAKGTMPERIFAQASVSSIGGISVFRAGAQISRHTYASFYSEEATIEAAVERLGNAGFEILYVTQSTVNIAGTQEQYERAFNTSLVTEERDVLKPQGNATTATFIECPNTPIPGLISTDGTNFADVLEGIAIEEPRYYMQPNAFPPVVDYWHLAVPQGVSLGCNADRAHRGGVTGKDVQVVMVDSGWFRHPFFVQRGYRVSPVVLGPGASDAEVDESGHGTGESANIFSVAPDAQLTPVKMSFTNSQGAFDLAVDLQPDIITCSWGSSRRYSLSAADQLLAASIAAAVDSGIVVVFSAGNGHWGFPGQHPDVISAGGAYIAENMQIQASDYASGFTSEIYTDPPRLVPDLCGLVGMRPRAIYIMLPLQPGDAIDVGNAGGSHPDGDETAPDDGWAAFSGTSAAAPQLAGAAALVREACDDLDPEEVRDVLSRTARDVTEGRSSPATDQTGTGKGNPASPGPDRATGHGLVDAHKATVLAKAKCPGPDCGPSDPAELEHRRMRAPLGPPTRPPRLGPRRSARPPASGGSASGPHRSGPPRRTEGRGSALPHSSGPPGSARPLGSASRRAVRNRRQQAGPSPGLPRPINPIPRPNRGSRSALSEDDRVELENMAVRGELDLDDFGR